MFKEMFNPVISPEAKKVENPETPEKSENFLAENFKTAIMDNTLIGYLNTKDKEKYLENHEISEYEKELIRDGREPSISLMIDIDGVLIDTEGELKNILEIMTGDFHILKNSIEAMNLIKNSKISFDVLRTLIQARDRADEVHLVTDRMGYGPCHFPCLGKKKRKTLEDHGLNLKTNAFKMFRGGDEFLPMIDKSDITYYIGSSGSDRIYTDRIRESMTKYNDEGIPCPIPNEKLKYLEIMPQGREKNIL